MERGWDENEDIDGLKTSLCGHSHVSGGMLWGSQLLCRVINGCKQASKQASTHASPTVE